jgi:hypothetical protein
MSRKGKTTRRVKRISSQGTLKEPEENARNRRAPNKANPAPLKIPAGFKDVTKSAPMIAIVGIGPPPEKWSDLNYVF